MRRACRPLLCSLAAAVLLAAAASAQQITSTPNVVGSGARALGMGGAFIAVADDATAASWNPGGLTQLERPEISAVYSFKFYNEKLESGAHPEMDGRYGVELNDLNYLSVVYPIPWTIVGRNLVLSLNYQRKFDFERTLNFDLKRTLTNGMAWDKIHYRQSGTLGSISPAIGFEIFDKLSVGLVMNIWDQWLIPDNEWQTRSMTRRQLLLATPGALTTVWNKATNDYDYEDFKGINWTVGVLFKPTARLSLGAVYHTKFTADVEMVNVTRAFPGAMYARNKRHLEYTFPSAVGVGAAYRFPGDKLTLSLDVTRRDWDQFVVDDHHNPQPGQRHRSAVTELPKYLSPHDATWTVRLGAEYVFVNEKKPKQHLLPSLRGGLFYDPEPASHRKNLWYGIGPYGLERKGSGKPDDYFGFSLGGGLLIMNRVNIDLAYVCRLGFNVRGDTFGQFGFKSTHFDVDQHTLYLSTVIYF